MVRVRANAHASSKRPRHWNYTAQKNHGPTLSAHLLFVAAPWLLAVSVLLSVGIATTHPSTATSWPPSSLFVLSDTTTKRQQHNIAYVVSLIQCGEDSDSSLFSNPALLLDAALVLRHSIHLAHQQQHSYNYTLVALVHTFVAQQQQQDCVQPLVDAGFTIQIVDAPLLRQDIVGQTLYRGIRKERCCGVGNFLPLYIYQMTQYDLVCSLDLGDVILNRQPLDAIFDRMLARPAARHQSSMDAVLVRDWPQIIPGRKALVRTGFMIVKPNPEVFDIVMEVIRMGDYQQGFGRDNGWGALGYGGLPGSMTLPGLLAYVYDTLLYDAWVELNQCEYNHVGMDVLYRKAPNFMPRHKKVGKCRNDREYCEDCMHTNVSKIYSIHYRACPKPWLCIGQGSRDTKDTNAIPEQLVDIKHCLDLQRVWHSIRTDYETKLSALTGNNETIAQSQIGTYKKDIFQGHCTGNGESHYLSLPSGPDALKRLPELYSAVSGS